MWELAQSQLSAEQPDLNYGGNMVSARKATVTAICAVAAVATTVTGMNVAAAEPGTADKAASSGGDNCVIELEKKKTTCFETREAAREKTRDWEMKFWGQTGYEGKWFVVQVKGNKCPKGMKELKSPYLSNLRLIADKQQRNFNNRISSLKTRHGCRARLYGRADFNGQKTKFLHKVPDLRKVKTNWNNAATSISFK